MNANDTSRKTQHCDAPLWGEVKLRASDDYLNRALDLWLIGDWEALTSTTSHVDDAHPDRATLQLLRAAALLQLGRTTEARECLARARQDNNVDQAWVNRVLLSGAHTALARGMVIYGNPSNAARHIHQSLALTKSDSKLALHARMQQQWRTLDIEPSIPLTLRVEPHEAINLGPAWAGNAVNTVIFRHHGILTWGTFQYTAFYVDASRLRLVQRNLDTNHIVTHDIAGDYNIRDAHNSISMGMDRQGCLHMCYDHHCTQLRYRRSIKPYDILDWTDELLMSGTHEEKVTYPTFILPRSGHPLTLLYRDGHHNRGSARLKTYDEDAQSWKDHPTPILSGADQRPWTSNAYWNHPAVAADGSLHLSFVWRTDVIGEHKLVNNINMSYAWSPDNGLHWFTAQGQPYKLPITPTTAETIWPSPVGNNLINQTSMALDSRGRPHIVFYANDSQGIPQYQHLWFNGTQWKQKFFSSRKNPFVLKGGGTLQIPISRPDILIDRHDQVYAIVRADFTDQKLAIVLLQTNGNSPDDAPNEFISLWPSPVGYTEPVIDRLRWQRDNILSLLVQEAQQPDGDLTHTDTQTPVWLLDIELQSAEKAAS